MRDILIKLEELIMKKKYFLRNGVDRHGLLGIKVVTRTWYGFEKIIKNTGFSELFFDQLLAEKFISRIGGL